MALSPWLLALLGTWFNHSQQQQQQQPEPAKARPALFLSFPPCRRHLRFNQKKFTITTLVEPVEPCRRRRVENRVALSPSPSPSPAPAPAPKGLSLSSCRPIDRIPALRLLQTSTSTYSFLVTTRIVTIASIRDLRHKGRHIPSHHPPPTTILPPSPPPLLSLLAPLEPRLIASSCPFTRFIRRSLSIADVTTDFGWPTKANLANTSG